jgi:hypothetical protein
LYHIGRFCAQRAAFGRGIGLIAVLALSLLATGCASRTNFSFPSFGLIGNDKDNEAAGGLDRGAGQSQRLIDGPSR